MDNVHCTVLRAMLNEAVPAGNSIDMSSPFVDAALPDGCRLHVVIPEITCSVLDRGTA